MNNGIYDIIPPDKEGLPFNYVLHHVPNTNPDLLRPKWHEQLEIKLILSGRVEIQCSTKCYFVQAGDIVVINSCELHSMRYLDEDVCYHLLIISTNQLYSDKLGEAILPVFNGSLCFNNLIRDNPYCQNILSALFDELEKKEDSYPMLAIGYITLFFGYLLRHQKAPDTFKEQYNDMRLYAGKLEPAFAYIHEHYTEKLSVESLAEMCEFSTYHFFHLFRQVTGRSVVTYINEVRVNKAEMLMHTTELKISEIARMVGFNNDSYFSRVFQKIKGYVPRSVRKE